MSRATDMKRWLRRDGDADYNPNVLKAPCAHTMQATDGEHITCRDCGKKLRKSALTASRQEGKPCPDCGSEVTKGECDCTDMAAASPTEDKP
jgi:predicted amidophosphoribosyltransferase